jgi:hypothetical protein
MKAAAMLLMLTASLGWSQTTPVSKPKISAEFSKPAIVALTTMYSGDSDNFKKTAVDAEAAASTTEEEKVMYSIRAFAVLRPLHQLVLATAQSYVADHSSDKRSKDRAKLAEAQDEVVKAQKDVDQDAVCYFAWKAQLKGGEVEPIQGVLYPTAPEVCQEGTK